MNALDGLRAARREMAQLGELIETRDELVKRASRGMSRREALRRSGTGHSPLEDNTLSLVELDRLIAESRARLHGRRRCALALIARTNKPGQKAVLVDYYLNGAGWAQIVEASGWSPRRVYQLHAEAVADIQEKLDHEFDGR